MTRDELLRRNAELHQRVLDLVAGRPDATLTAAGPDGWTIRDHLGHLADWQQYVADLLAGATTPRGVPTADELDRLNAEILARVRRRSPAEALADLESSYAALRVRLEPLDDAALDQPPPYGRDWDRRLWQHVAGNAFAHYQEHLEEIERRLTA